MSFSVVMPVHNEQEFLPLSLPSVYKLNPKEVLVLLDSCSDDSEKIVKDLSFKHKMSHKTRVIHVKDVDGWRMRFAFLRFFGCSVASSPVVLITAGDIILDSKITAYLSCLNDDVKFVSFGYVDVPVNWRNMLKRLMTRILPSGFGDNWISGIHAFCVKEAFECEDLDELRTIEAAQDTHIHKAIQKRYDTIYLRTKTVHLRPKESGDRHYLRGKLYWNVAKRGWFVALVNGVLFFRLNLIKGYIHARLGGKP